MGVLVVSILGCSVRAADVVLSPNFNVCTSLRDSGGGYRLNHDPRIDWDEGILMINGEHVDVYVGRHPDFDRKLKGGKQPVDRRFVLVGRVETAGRFKILLAQRLSIEQDDFLYVMFSGDRKSGEVEKELLGYSFPRDCAQ